jgi:methionyl aminopeptidase
MTIKTPEEIRIMERACQLAAKTLYHTAKFAKAGITTNELDQIANDFVLSNNAISACIGYHGYPKAICTSVNEMICHGVPDQTILKDGDIINIDVTVIKDGFHGDTSATFYIGDVSEKAKRLTEAAKAAMMIGIEAITPDGTTGDIGFAINKYTTKMGYFAVREIGGHGIGRVFHEEPFVPSFGKKGRGERLRVGGTITVEPMLNETNTDVVEHDIPGSAIKAYTTANKCLSAQFEHTVYISQNGPVILTLP